jgi:aryl-alcohol dehydrogenase-like predicted oxidoreductase
MSNAKPPALAGAGIPRRPLGRTGVEVSILALGGFHLGAAGSADACARIVHEALDEGLDFLDNCWEYHDGRSEEWVGRALQGRRAQAFVMTKVCTHGRGRKTALEQLEQSLTRLRTDHVDLWQIHECVYDDEPERYFAKDGAVSALDTALQQGKARFVGFTGHKDPSIHLGMLARGYPFHTCQLPLNCFDASYRSFERLVLPELARQGVAALGMKSFGGDGIFVRRGDVTAAEALGYALSLPVAAVVSGVESVEVLRQNLAIARGPLPLDAATMDALRARCAPVAADGRVELYKSSKRYDGDPGREQHGFPPHKDLLF